MNQILFFFLNIITFPYRMLVAPSQGLKSTWGESGRSRAMLLGIPALVVASIGFAAVAYAQFGNIVALEDYYKDQVEDTVARRTKIMDDVAKDVRTQRIQQGTVAAQDSSVSVDEDLQRQLDDVEKEQLIYLNKLISIDPENKKYRFDLAQISARQGNPGRAMAILESIAPRDTPGYAQAHFLLAQQYTMAQAKTRMQMLGNVEIALEHVNHGLAREPGNRNAKKMKAELLRRKQSEASAYVILEELFEDEPKLFRALVDINKKLGRPESDNKLILDRAMVKFAEKLRSQEVLENDQVWVETWQGLITCKQRLKEFEDAEKLLENEIRDYSQKSDGGPRRVFLEQLLSAIYYAWSQELGTIEQFDQMDASQQASSLEFYKKAYQYNNRNGMVLQGLARLTVSRFPEIQESARAIYDPERHVDAPAVVLNQLGTQALINRDYESAIQYYERAREKEPNNSAVLNNLAYAYLVSEEPNPSRALQLIDEAIRYLPSSGRSPELLTRYWHTKGTALMQLDRLNEAIGEFERAIQPRPNNIEILQALIQCYKGTDLEPPQQYLERLEAQLEKEARGRATQGG